MSNAEVEKIRKKLGHLTFKWEPALWLDVGVPGLHRVLGHKDKGIPYGRMIQISGLESHGKTAIALSLAAMAQRDKAAVVWLDLENSFDKDWAAKRGLDPEPVYLIQPYIGQFGKEKERRLTTAEELCEETEESMVAAHAKNDRMIVVVDSIPALVTEADAAAGFTDRSMRTNMEVPMLLGTIMKRWVALAMRYNALIIFINQLRQNPMQKFGSPWYEPGGNAPRFFCHVMVRVVRTKGSQIKNKGETIGIRGVMTAKKNKTGGVEGADIGYKLIYNGKLSFVSASQVRKEGEG